MIVYQDTLRTAQMVFCARNQQVALIFNHNLTMIELTGFIFIQENIETEINSFRYLWIW